MGDQYLKLKSKSQTDLIDMYNYIYIGASTMKEIVNENRALIKISMSYHIHCGYNNNYSIAVYGSDILSFHFLLQH